MEKHLLRLIKLADELNEKQDKVYAEIHYSGDNSKKLEIYIRVKRGFSYVEKLEMKLTKDSLINWESAVNLLENYVKGGANSNE